MELRHPEYIAAIFAFALLLFLLTRIRRVAYGFSSRFAVRKISFSWGLLACLSPLLYLGTVLALLIALAAPFVQKSRNETVIEGKIIVPCIDVSGSMDMLADDKRTKLQVIQDTLKEFLESRSEVDAVGLSAFSGGGDAWGAAIIQRPTLSKETFIASSQIIKSQMFGGNTAIGEGIFVSVLALSEMEWHKKLQEESGDSDKEFDIRRLWAAVNTLDLPELGLPNPDAKTKDEAIISEAVRLTPPNQNRNKIIILFSDGDSNEGLDPIKSIWLAQRLGIRVYYIEVLAAPSNQEDIEGSKAASTRDQIPKLFLAAQQPAQERDYSQIPEHRRNLILAIKRTGGEYFGGQSYNEIHDFFMEVSRLEKGKVTMVEQYDTQENYIFWVQIACIFFVARVLLKILTSL